MTTLRPATRTAPARCSSWSGTYRLRQPGTSSSVARAAQLCALSAESGSADEVQYLHSAYLPAEDTCFCLFRAATAEAVRALNDEASFALDRITGAVQLYPTGQASDEPRKPITRPT